MHYILDGYNVIHKTPSLEALLSRSLQKAREGLILLCKTLLQTRGDVEKITIIFDGVADVFSGGENLGKVEVIYSSAGEDADDRIVEYLRGIRPSRAAVVSDDNYVSNNARAFKVKSFSVADFLELSNSKFSQRSRKNGPSANPSGKQINCKERNDITQAYADYLGLSPERGKN